MISLTPSDWLSISGLAVSAMAMVVSAMVAIWIVDKLQRSLENRQQLKDHLSKEVLAVRELYRDFVMVSYCKIDHSQMEEKIKALHYLRGQLA